jgi:putative nucleotidyltransferase with HDIG domain
MIITLCIGVGWIMASHGKVLEMTARAEGGAAVSAAASREALAFQPFIDALTAHVALIDGDGGIVSVNNAWKRFADRNQDQEQAGYGVGCNYLRLLEGVRCCRLAEVPPDAKAEQDEAIAIAVAAGLRQVLAGQRDKFQLEYPCDSPTERRWFLLTITPFPSGQHLRAVVAHEELTALKLAQERALQQSEQLNAAFISAIDAIARFVEKRDPYTAGHQHQVSALCANIARHLGLAEERVQGLILGAKIHDIGKIAVPAEILGKPGRLSPPEFALIRYHPETGLDILQGIDFPWPIADMVHQHHERFDGSGYPQGLVGEAICLEARILAVADVFDAIISHRPYRAARAWAEGVAELQRGRGSAYDPAVVDACLAYLDEVAAQGGLPHSIGTPH